MWLPSYQIIKYNISLFIKYSSLLIHWLSSHQFSRSINSLITKYSSLLVLWWLNYQVYKSFHGPYKVPPPPSSYTLSLFQYFITKQHHVKCFFNTYIVLLRSTWTPQFLHFEGFYTSISPLNPNKRMQRFKFYSYNFHL